MKHIIHALAGTTAMTLILTFWTATLISEAALDAASVAFVKKFIVYGLFVLVPCLAITGGSGIALSQPNAKGLVGKKKKRMAFAALNGLLLMIPAGLFLNYKAGQREFDKIFYAVQIIELCVGIAQLSFLGLNFRDGLRMRRARLIRGNAKPQT